MFPRTSLSHELFDDLFWGSTHVFQGCRISHVVKAEHSCTPLCLPLSNLVCGSRLSLLSRFVLYSLKWSGHLSTVSGE